MHQPEMENEAERTTRTSLAAQVIDFLFSHIKEKSCR